MVKKTKQKAVESIALDSKNQTAFSKAVKNIKNSIKKKEVEPKYRRGIILVNHLPHGFFEDELTGFFKQFGKVLRVRVGRSLKTGRSKGYAFIEFEFEEVAKIAAEAMNNYLMYERLIKCTVVDSSARGAQKIFALSDIRPDNYPTLTRRNKFKAEQAELMDTVELEELAESRLNRISKHNAKLADLGLEYQFGDEDAAIPVQEKFVRTKPTFKPVLKAKAERKAKALLEKQKSPKKEKAIRNVTPRTPPKSATPKASHKATPKSAQKATPKQPTPKSAQKATPKQPTPKSAQKATPKQATPKSAQFATPKSVQKATPKQSTPKSAQKTTPKQPTPKSTPKATPKSTPKLQTPDKSAKKTETPKVAPVKTEKVGTPAQVKVEKADRKSEKSVVPENKRKSVKKAKTPEKFSPKVLRSRGRQSEAPVSLAKSRKSESAAVAAGNKRKSVKVEKKVKTPEKPSPKMLRSRARQSEPAIKAKR